MRPFKIEKTETQYIVTWQYYSLAVFFVLFIVLAGLTVGGIFFAHWAFVQREFLAIPFALAIWGFMLLILASIVHSLFGKTEFILDENGFNITYTCLIHKHEKKFDIAIIRHFEKYIRRSRRGQPSYWFRVVCHDDHSSKTLGCSATNEELDDLCAQLNIFLGTLKAEAAGVPVNWELPEPIGFYLDSPVQHLEPPLESRWHYQTEFNDIGFQKRGEDTIGHVIGSSIFPIIFNSILAITAFLRGEMSGEMVFFVFVGLCCFITPLNYFLELFRITNWTFVHGAARFRTVRLVWVRSANYELTDWHSLVVRLPADEKVKPELIADGNPDAIRDFYNGCERWQLAFLNAAGEQLLAIENVSKPEALWMADVVLREQRMIR